MKKSAIATGALLLSAALLAPASATQAAPGHKPGGTSPQSGTTKPAQQYTAPALTWGECASASLRAAKATCTMLEVPLDYAQPKGATIKVAVSRILHTDPDYRGMIAVNPGGPGGSGLGLARLGRSVPNGVGAKYDWYGFDPRGVGSSQPALSCDPDYAGQNYDRPNYIPDGTGNEEWWLTTTADYATACGTSDAKMLLGHMGTRAVATDLDVLRRAVGQKKLNYYGFSYGTYLGQAYATLFPKSTGRFVMDGVMDADRAFYLSNVDQNVAFDQNIERWFTWLAQNDERFGLGTDAPAIRRGYYELLKKLDVSPAADGKLGPDELNDVLLSAAYYVYGWVDLGDAYATLVKTGDGAPILSNYGGPGDDSSFAGYVGVQCTDTPWPTWKKTKADAWQTHGEHPFLTWGNTWFNAPCLDWPVKATPAMKMSGKKVKSPLLLIAETHDAATPYNGALVTRQKFPTASLIEGVGGTTHSGSLSGVPCTDDAVATFLDTGVVPKRVKGNRSDLQCDPVPAPNPNALRGRSAAPAAGLPADLRAILTEAQQSMR